MANATTATGEKKVKVTLPLLEGEHTSQDVFVAVNFKSYRIKRGEEVEIPESVYNALMESNRAKDAEIREKQKRAFRSPEQG
jgi:hypothetical protein